MKRYAWTLMAAGLCAVLLTLAGCGGGDAEPEQDVPRPGVDCKANPQLCI